MDIASIEICEVRIPFRFRYGHASAQHGGVESIICIARDNAGREGLGEAVPRTYVTGETPASVMTVLPKLIRRTLSEADSFAEFQSAIAGIESAYPDKVPACAICALELAVTDLFAQQAERSVVDHFGGAKKSPLTYTASIGISSKRKLTALLLVYKAMGLREFKVKVGDKNDIERVRTIRRMLGREVSIFADANAAWDKKAAVQKIEKLAAEKVWAVEEPLRIHEAGLNGEHFADCAWLQSRSPVPLIADESLISLRGAREIVETDAFRIFNIRLSKCGGYLRSDQFATIARERSLRFSIGAMVGESPVLAAAGAAFGASHPDYLYIQGHSHWLLHGRRFIEGCPRLKHGGKFIPKQSKGAGLEIDHSQLDAIVTKRETIDLK